MMPNPLNFTESESERTEYSDNESQQLSDTTSAGLRKKLHRYIQKEKDEGGDEFDVIVNMLVAQERKLAKLELQQSAQRPG